MASFAFLVESMDLSRGGAERAVLDLAEALVRAGHRVGAFAPGDRAGAEASGVEIHGAPLNERSRPRRAAELAERLPEAARAAGFETLVSCGKILGADVHWPHGGVHAAGRAASTAAGRGRARAFLAAKARALRPVEKVFDRIEAAIYQRVREGRTRALAISKLVRADMSRLHHLDQSQVALAYNGAPLGRIPHGSEARAAQRPELLRRLGLPEEAFILALIAMNPRLKGAGQVPKLLRRAPDRACVLYVGKAPKHSLGPRERFIGHLPDLSRWYPAFDGLLLPTFYDPCSLVTLEGTAAALPILTTSKNGAAELLTPDESVLIADDEAAMAAGLRELVEAPERARALGLAARRAAEAWSCDDAASVFSELTRGGG